MYIILVCINKFQEYILDNIKQLIRLYYNNIIVITEKSFFDYFEKYKNNIKLIDKNDLYDTFNYSSKATLEENKNGFWHSTSYFFHGVN